MPPVDYHLGQFPPTNNIDWAALVPLLGPANAALARYDGMLRAIPNAHILLSPLMTQEAVLSSKIEGTYTTMGEVMEFEAGKKQADPEKREDMREVLNYRSSMYEALNLMKELPLCQRVIRSAHEVLLDGVRGKNKSPGRYRTTQNYIGQKGRTPEQARFVPIAPEKLNEAMGAWENFIHAESPDALVQLAILHAEFEAIHPFNDGNGRMGRMLVPLFLFQKGMLHQPSFYISAYFERHRDEYYDGLLAVSRDGDWTGWCEYFLKSVIAQAQEDGAKVQEILALYGEKKKTIAEATNSKYASYVTDFLFERPIFNGSTFVHSSEIPHRSARRLLQSIEDHGLVLKVAPSSGRSSGIYVFKELMNITEGRKEF